MAVSILESNSSDQSDHSSCWFLDGSPRCFYRASLLVSIPESRCLLLNLICWLFNFNLRRPTSSRVGCCATADVTGPQMSVCSLMHGKRKMVNLETLPHSSFSFSGVFTWWQLWFCWFCSQSHTKLHYLSQPAGGAQQLLGALFCCRRARLFHAVKPPTLCHISVVSFEVYQDSRGGLPNWFRC